MTPTNSSIIDASKPLPSPGEMAARKIQFQLMDELQVSGDQSETLYHCTTQAGLLGIVGSRSLWATEAKYMNDLTEYVGALEYATHAVSSRSELLAQDPAVTHREPPRRDRQAGDREQQRSRKQRRR